jgi:hypothetical protein
VGPPFSIGIVWLERSWIPLFIYVRR